MERLIKYNNKLLTWNKEYIVAEYVSDDIWPPDGSLGGVYTIGPMTNNTAPSPFIANQSSYYDNNATYLAYRMFNEYFGTSNDAWASGHPVISPVWVSIDLGTSISIWKYGLYPHDVGYKQWASAFQLQGSTDNVNWVTLDTRTATLTEWTTREWHDYTLPEISRLYRYFRLYCTATNPGYDYIMYTGLRFYQYVIT